MSSGLSDDPKFSETIGGSAGETELINRHVQSRPSKGGKSNPRELAELLQPMLIRTRLLETEEMSLSSDCKKYSTEFIGNLRASRATFDIVCSSSCHILPQFVCGAMR